MTRQVFNAMGTEIEAWCDDVADAASIVDWFETVEGICTRFRTDSELNRINRSPDRRLTPSHTLFEVLEAADRARRLTDGIVDIGTGAVVRSWGYDRTFSEVVDRPREPTGPSSGEWSLQDRSLIREGSVELDLGGIAKGWTCDRAVEKAMASVVSAGGDLRSAHPETTVSVTGADGETAMRVKVGVGALATSSIAKRRWRVSGRHVSHIVDPRSMRPVITPITSATVIADTAVDAEAGAKAVLILGTEGLAWAADQPWISAALVIWHDGSVFATPGVEVAA